jgi:PBSX family phage portal protein
MIKNLISSVKDIAGTFRSDGTVTSSEKSLAFSFGDPEPVLSNRLTDYLGTFLDFGGDYYRPPVDLGGLASLMNANAYHGPILHFKKNMIVKWFQPSKQLSTHEMKSAALDYAVLANAYFQKFTDRFGNVLRLKRLPAVSMRQGKAPDVFFKLNSDGSKIEFKPGEVIHIKEADIKQNIYGVPQYLGGIQSVLLSEDATLFRRKYYVNGAHMGYILVTTDANLDDTTAKTIEDQVRSSKGPGNFRSLYLNIPRSNNKEPVKVIPVGNIGSKDEFQAIKEIAEMDMLAMHRVYPGLVAVMPANIGGFGDLQKSMEVYHELEVTAMQRVFLEINEMIPGNPVAFREPDWKKQANTAQSVSH